MKLIKKLTLAFMILLVATFFVGCDFFNFTTAGETTYAFTTTVPLTHSGTISYSDNDYNNFPTYTSPSYSLSVAAYNQVLIDTREYIRHANIQIVNSQYSYSNLPFVHQTQKILVGTMYGSGFIFMDDATDYYALTNYHVVNPEGNESEYAIQCFGDTDSSSATLVTYDSDKDLAVLKFPKNDRSGITIINIYKRLNYKFNVGELVLAVGNPQELENNVTFGEFKGMEAIENVNFKVIFHDASIHSGSSGGALVDVDGNLLGINAWGADDNDEYSFAIPNYIVYEFLVNKGILD